MLDNTDYYYQQYEDEMKRLEREENGDYEREYYAACDAADDAYNDARCED